MSLTDYEQNILAKVAEYGCFITSVFGDDERPPFSYSVGLWEIGGASEVIIVGLPGDLSARMINILCAFLKDKAVTIHDGAVIEGLLEGYSCIVRRVDGSQIDRDFFNSALWYHQLQTGKPLTDIYQIVWPSVGGGLFPWENGCPAEVVALQTALYLPKART
jgi:hypothetical protein